MIRHQLRPASRTAIAAVLLFCAACAHSSGKPAESPPARNPDAVVQAVARLAATYPAQVGSTDPLDGDQPLVSTCGGTDDAFTVEGNYAIALLGPPQRPAFKRLRDRWTAAGWSDVRYREFDQFGVRAEVSGTAPNTKYSVSLTSSLEPVTSVQLLIDTPCYQRS
jgi:hypothetical protein